MLLLKQMTVDSLHRADDFDYLNCRDWKGNRALPDRLRRLFRVSMCGAHDISTFGLHLISLHYVMNSC